MRTRRLLFAGTTVAGLMLAAWMLFPRPLLQRATRLTGPRYWWSHWFWLSDHEILTFTKAGKRLRAIRLDIETGTETELSGLSRTFDQLTPGGEMHLSPDRQTI